MSIGLIFWILMLLWLVLGLWQAWPGTANQPYAGWYPIGSTLLLFILFLLLGWASFGPPVHG